MKNITYILVILYLMFGGADRINLGINLIDSFLLTPHIIISFFFIVFQLLIRNNSIQINWLIEQKYFFVTILLFFITLIISSFLSIDIFFSFKRIVLLFSILITVIFILSSLTKKELDNCVYFGSILGSLLFYFFNILLFLKWMNYFDFTNNFINYRLDTINLFYPRFSGQSMDANRGCFLLIFYTYFLIINKKENLFKDLILFFNIFFIFVSFSRTGIMLLVVSILLYVLFYSTRKNRLKIYIISVIVSLSIFSITNYFSNLDMIDLDSAISERLTIDGGHDTSGGIHIKLIKDGLNIVKNDLKIFLIGCGYGTSWKIIKGYFMSGKKRANFHSQYVSFLVESGMISLILCLLLTIIFPLCNQNHVFPFLFGLFFFNLFYQLHHDPIYWFSIFYYYKVMFFELEHA